jgi:hexosaminidase
MQRPQLLPHPRQLRLTGGDFVLPRQAMVQLEASLAPDEARSMVGRLQDWSAGLRPGANDIRIETRRAGDRRPATITVKQLKSAPIQPEFHTLTITRSGITMCCRELPGLRAAIATLRQLLRQYGRRLPCLVIRDWPDFARRGFMLDISRGRVPKLATLLDLADRLAEFKINELQLYTEHTFAYRKWKSVWRDWGALSGAEIRKLDAHCRELGIELVPNQNSFGHLREFLAHPKLKPLAEIAQPWPDGGGTFWRYPSTLAPNHPRTLPFLRSLYDELLPHFSSRHFNLGGDETWDLGRGQSAALCQRRGKGRVYLDFLRRLHREARQRGRRMMFWGDIILNHPELIPQLPRDVIALNWGYEADHPFPKETARFARAKIPFYVCPGTSTWMTLIGKHDNAFANLRAAARAGRKNGALGYLITDWGDGGHPQPLAASWLPLLVGAAASWCEPSFNEAELPAIASRELFHDPTGKAAPAALALGFVHRKLKFTAPNTTPLGAAIAAPKTGTFELFCRDGLKYFALIRRPNLRAALQEIERQRRQLANSRPADAASRLLVAELDLAARMAAQSAQLMLWQQAVAAGKTTEASRRARRLISDLRKLDRDFTRRWPARNKATPKRCSAFLQWRIAELQKSLKASPRG